MGSEDPRPIIESAHPSGSGREAPRQPLAWSEREPDDATDAVPHADVQNLGFVGEYLVCGASRRGRSHAHSGTYREDAIVLSADADAPWWLIAVADGAGSCPLSRVGSGLATREAARYVRDTWQTGADLAKLVSAAAEASLLALQAEAGRRQCPLTHLSCTLLLLLVSGGEAAVFQAGDGIVASISENGSLAILAQPDSEEFAGATHFLTGDHVRGTWTSRTRIVRLDPGPAGFLVATDGVSDDLVPYERNGPIITREISRIVAGDDPGLALLGLLGYEKRGSFDDRTLAVAWRRQA